MELQKASPLSIFEMLLPSFAFITQGYLASSATNEKLFESSQSQSRDYKSQELPQRDYVPITSRKVFR